MGINTLENKDVTNEVSDASKKQAERIDNTNIAGLDKAMEAIGTPVIKNGELMKSIEPPTKYDLGLPGDRGELLKLLGAYEVNGIKKQEQFTAFYNKLSSMLGSNQIDLQTFIEENAHNLRYGVLNDNKNLAKLLVQTTISQKSNSKDTQLSDGAQRSSEWNNLSNRIFQKYGAKSEQYKLISMLSTMAETPL